MSDTDAAFAGWRATPASERARLLIRVADAYDARREELAKLISTEMGKPMQEAVGPAVLTGVTKDMDASSEEIFGPVAVIHGVDSSDEAVALANDVGFGLRGSVWGSDIERAQEIADRLEVGMAHINEHGTTLPGLPFGGVKRSGFGRELGRWGMGEFVNTRLRRTSTTKK